MIFITVLSVRVHLLWSQFIGVNARTLVWYQINLGHIYIFFMSVFRKKRKRRNEKRKRRRKKRRRLEKTEDHSDMFDAHNFDIKIDLGAPLPCK